MDSETPEGMRLLYDLLVKASEYPGESPHNPRNLYNWGQKLKGLEHILSGYLDEEYMHEKRVLEKEIREVSKEYPSDRYISDGYDKLYSWLGLLATQYQRLGLLIPEDLTYTEGGEEGI